MLFPVYQSVRKLTEGAAMHATKKRTLASVRRCRLSGCWRLSSAACSVVNSMMSNVARFRPLSKSIFPRYGGPLLRTDCIPRCCSLLVVGLRPNPPPQTLPQRHDLVLAGQGLQTVTGHAGAAVVQPGNGRQRAMLCVAGGGLGNPLRVQSTNSVTWPARRSPCWPACG